VPLLVPPLQIVVAGGEVDNGGSLPSACLLLVRSALFGAPAASGQEQTGTASFLKATPVY
jgi:hypothetical protein